MKTASKVVPFSFLVYHFIVKNNLQLRPTIHNSRISSFTLKKFFPHVQRRGCNLLDWERCTFPRSEYCSTGSALVCRRARTGRATNNDILADESISHRCVALKLPGKTWPAPISICSLLSFELDLFYCYFTTISKVFYQV